MPRLVQIGLVAALALPVIAAARLGGWATITVEELPDHLVVGEPVRLDFTLRQHGVAPIGDAKPAITVTDGKATMRIPASRGRKPGSYGALLDVAKPGTWRVSIHSGFGNSEVTLHPLPAVHAGSPPPTVSAFERGHRLFVAKGCLTCHLHQDVKASGVVAAGPELTGRRFPGEYLERFLADPSITPPRGQDRMPDLDLDPKEIAALIAFINDVAPRHAESAGTR